MVTAHLKYRNSRVSTGSTYLKKQSGIQEQSGKYWKYLDKQSGIQEQSGKYWKYLDKQSGIQEQSGNINSQVR